MKHCLSALTIAFALWLFSGLMVLAQEPCLNGMAGSYPCHNIDLLSHVPLNSMGGGNGNDVWGWTDDQSGKEYALMGRNNGLSLVDISDPTTPVYLGNLPPNTNNSLWRDVKVYQNYAFIVSEAAGHGLQIFDLTQLRAINNPPLIFGETTHYNGFGNAHNIAINEETGYAYVVGSNTCSGGLHIINIQNPLNPTFVGCFSEDGYTHDTQCVLYTGPDADYTGQEICFNANEDTLTLVDVTAKNAPEQIARQGYAGSRYSHQGWLTEDQQYFLLGDELDESRNGHNTRTYIWDVQDLDNPFIVGNYTAQTPAIDHNLYTHNNQVYQANYQAGLRILSTGGISQANLTELAYFDTYPANDNPAYNGAWSVYPYFKSGVVVVSDMNSGLFILEPSQPNFTLTVSPKQQDACINQAITYTVSIKSRHGFSETLTFSSTSANAMPTSFRPNTLYPLSNTLTSTLTLTPALAGVVDFKVTAQGASISHNQTAKLQVWGNALSPSLSLPANQATVIALKPTLSWTASSSASHYKLELARTPAFTDIIYTAQTTANSHTLTQALSTATTYYWRTKVSNPCGESDFSAPFSFTTVSNPLLAQADQVVTLKNTPITLTVLANDIHTQDQDFYIGAVSHAQSGTVTALSTTLIYSPNLNFSGSDYFTYSIRDEAGWKAETGVQVQVVQGDGLVHISPGQSNTLSWPPADADGISPTLYLDAGAVSQTISLVYEILPPPPPKMAENTWAGLTFAISVYQNGQLISPYMFAKPLTLSLSYPPQYFSPEVGCSLRLYTKEDQSWSKTDIKLTSCDTSNQTMAFSLNKTGQFALFKEAAVLSLEKSVQGITDTQRLPLGSVLTYTLRVLNQGGETVQGISVVDQLPIALQFGSYISASSTAQTAQLPLTQKLRWGPYDLPAHSEVELSFTTTLQVDEGLYGQSITNTATFSSITANFGQGQAHFRVELAPGPKQIYLPVVVKN